MPQRSLLTYFSAPPINSSAQWSIIANGTSPEPENSCANGTPHSGASSADTRLPRKGVPCTQAPSQPGPDAECRGSRTDQATLAAVSFHDLPAAKRLTCALLPVRYPESFFTGAIDDPTASHLSRVIKCNNAVVGWIRCRLDVDQRRVSENTTVDVYSVYIQALCVQPAYQGQGYGRALLNDVCQSANKYRYVAQKITAHVWEDNVDAITWYERQGFKRIILIDSYYRKLRPAGAWTMEKDLG